MSKKKNKSNKFSLTPAQEQILHNQVIDETQPGTILRDFEILLDFVGEKGSQVTSKQNRLPLNQLPQLNSQLTHPIKIDLKRPQNKSFPHINGLYLLLRSSGLALIKNQGKTSYLILDQAVLQSWRALNPVERYFTLLEAWLFKSTPEIIGEYGGPLYEPLSNWFRLFDRIPKQGLKIAGDKKLERRISYPLGFYGIALLELFGFLTVEHGNPEKGKGWRIMSVQKTALGEIICTMLFKPMQEGDIIDFLQHEFEQKTSTTFGELQPSFQPFFPEWQNNLIIPESEFQDGIYVFKVSLGSVWRRIAIPGTLTFSHLSGAILDAYEFDYDHLYSFNYKDRFGRTLEINHPFMDDEPPLADDVAIGDIALSAGTQIDFLYDFGDNWQFGIVLERIDPKDATVKAPRLLESRGKAPEQYYYPDDWDEY